MPEISPLVIGVFQQEGDARRALKALEDTGFARDQIGFALPQSGSATHSLRHDLIKQGIPEDNSTYYESEYQAGHAIISVQAAGREQEAASILQQYGGYNQETQENAATEPLADGEDITDGPGSLHLREERLNVEKQRVESGEVRLHKEVVEEHQSIDVPVTHEEVFIQRRTINDKRISDTPITQDETIRIPVLAEQVTVIKTPVETGEVVIGKRTVQENQRFTDTVRREEARLDKKGDIHIHADEDLLNS